MERQRKHFSSLSAFTAVAISINIPSCNLSVTFLKSVFLQDRVVGGCSTVLFSACSFPQDMDVSEQQLWAVTAGQEAAGVRCSWQTAVWQQMGGVWRESKAFLWMISAFLHACWCREIELLSEKRIVAVELRSLPQFAWGASTGCFQGTCAFGASARGWWDTGFAGQQNRINLNPASR